MNSFAQIRVLLPLLFLALSAGAAPSPGTTSSPRINLSLDSDWRFSKGDFPDATMPAFNDAGWRKLNLPHDWSAEGPFGPQFASGNGYAPGGIGWYRKHFRLDPDQIDKIVAVEFDGVYDHAQVWINGHYVGGRPYGYSSFECVLTPLLKFGTEENVLAVRVDHSRFADSRWYTGSGIYRHVRLRITDKLRVGHWGTYITTPDISPETASVRVETTIENGSDQPVSCSLHLDVVAPDGTVAATAAAPANVARGTNQTLVRQIPVPRPRLWSLATPSLYALNTRLSVGDRIVDQTTTPFGIRTLRFDPDKGFFLNGVPTKFKGVCLHHEAGSLGAAVPAKVWERRLRLLKELGANAIRTSHNPPSPEFLDLCDRLGLLVKDEAFDEFTPAKNKWVAGWNEPEPSRFGYAESFQQWSVIDVRDMVRRDRNHPSVILWSIGNEIDYPNDPFSHPVLGKDYRPANPPAENLITCAQPLVAAVKEMDLSRPVTAALANLAMSDAVGLPQLLDVVGYNYQESRYVDDHRKYPKRFIFGSENGGQPANWTIVLTNDFVAGQFLWTGIDYLGEARRWPNRGSGAGLLDLCGFKKPFAWFRQSLWSDQPMVYLCTSSAEGRGQGRRPGGWAQEHWNWTSNSTATIHCWTTCSEVTLTLNQKPLETKRLNAPGSMLTWQLPFEPGTLKAVGRRDGNPLCEFVLTTAASPARIQLLPDSTTLQADGQDVAHVEFRIVDAHGVRVPDAASKVTFTVNGPAEILGVENGDLNSPDTGKDRLRQAYHGRGLVILQATREAGKIQLTAQATGLEDAQVEFTSSP